MAYGGGWEKLILEPLKIRIKQVYLSSRRFIIYFFIRPYFYKKEISFHDQEIKKILVVRLERIGDLIISLPALKMLRQVFTHARISVLVREKTGVLLADITDIDEVIPYRGFMQTVRQLRQRKFDLAIDPLMDYRLKTAFLVSLSGARFTAGFDIEARGYFFNLTLRPAVEKKHVSKYILDLIKVIAKYFSQADADIEVGYPKLPILEQKRSEMKFYLKEQGIEKEGFLVGIHPGGYYSSQRWPIDKFSQLADRIAAKYKTKIIIIGSNKEDSLIEQVVSSMKEEAIKISGLTLDKLAVLISLLDIFICNNSGPLHIACAVKTPTVSTMGPTDPDLWWPQGQRHIVLRRNLFCSPCNRAKCKKHECMELISVEEMLQAVNVLMQNDKYSPR